MDCVYAESESDLIKEVNTSYKSAVLDIFKQKCFHCHNINDNQWYKERLLFKDFFQEQVELAVSGYEMTEILPEEDLKDSLKMIIAEVENETMPPWINFFIRPFNDLSSEEANIISDWAKKNLDLLKNQ